MVTYGFFNSVNGDRKYDANQMTEFYNGIVTEGVFQHVDNGLEVTGGVASDNTLIVNIDSGRAIIQNRWLKNTASYILNLAAPDQVYGRIDAIVARLDMDNRVIAFYSKTGTPSSSPVAPSVTRSGNIYEICLAYATVPANSTSAPTITDKRSDPSVCGWASVAQAASGEVETILNDLKTGYNGTVYNSPGEAVRGSDSNLQGEIYRIFFSNAGTTNYKLDIDKAGGFPRFTLKLPVTTGGDSNAFWIYYGNTQKKVSYARSPFSLNGSYYEVKIPNGQALKYNPTTDAFVLQGQHGSNNNNEYITLLGNNIGSMYGYMAFQFLSVTDIENRASRNRLIVSNAAANPWMYSLGDGNNDAHIIMPKDSTEEAIWIYYGNDQYQLRYPLWSFVTEYPKYYKFTLYNGQALKYNLLTGAVTISGVHSVSDSYNNIIILENNMGTIVGPGKNLLKELRPNRKDYGYDSFFMSNAKAPIDFSYTNATKKGVILSPDPSKAFMAGMVESPSIIYDDDLNKYLMVFTAYSTGNVGSIGIAESTDLETWTNVRQFMTASGNSSNGDAYGCTGPCLVKQNGTYYLFYLGLNGSGYEGEPINMCLATTSDIANPTWSYKGIVVPIQNDVAWCNRQIYHPCYMSINGKSMLMFNARGVVNNKTAERSGFAVSDKIDGNYIVNDTRISQFAESLFPNNFIMCGDPAVVEIDDILYLFYFTASTSPDHACDYVAYTTKDLFPYGWKNIAQATNTDQSYDGKYAHKPFVIKKGSKLYHYYTAVSSSNVRTIALQTFDI